MAVIKFLFNYIVISIGWCQSKKGILLIDQLLALVLQWLSNDCSYFVKKQERMTYTLGEKQAVETACENNQRVDLTDRLQHIYYKYIPKRLPWWSSG